ncbi:hypothetical protein GUITHDRAFT_151174 [Guillardia theta CCMP2712]|nr:hypothetical protein GUITHDRAFT_151174 [Guillardia theta CCMP2712]EKX50501.1 hypothetical protein GUITHDRAFT_151174 [Guillardia theta CCMP2712]|mmetsp:Transcript_11801/g.40697  ORF Transcript_11801/g.40697 Transcript_11801/m.40697 type:complete len:134 (+) Transcript_11801:78-479(+)|eukprot:XP_005837481.1 hypothetical protein GUITHDRAFT_151174 [Guillardia theta CCMP2712]
MEVKATRVKVCPRPRGNVLSYSPQEPVSLDQALVKSLFHLTQYEAAQAIGISLSSLKLACRRMGIRKWPYNRRNMSRKSETKRPAGKEGSGASEGEEEAAMHVLFAQTRPYWLESGLEELLEESLMHVSGRAL